MKNKKQLNLFPFYDLEGMEDHFHKMAMRGWFIKKASGLVFSYESGTPRDMQFAICYGGESSVYTPGGEDQAPCFKDRASQKGWNPVYISEKLQVYSSEDEKAGSFHASAFDRIEGIHQASKPILFLYGTMILVGILSLILMLFKWKTQPVNLLSGSMGFLSPIVLSILAVYSLTEVIAYLHWKNKADVAATKKICEPAPQFPGKIFPYILAVSSAVILFGLLTSGSNPTIRIFLISLVVILSVLMGIGSVRNLALEKGKTKSIALLNLILGLILVIGLIFAMNAMAKADAGFQGSLPVRAQDLGLGGEEILDYSRSSASFLLRHTEASQVKQAEDGSYEPVLSYEIVEGRMLDINGWVVKYYLDRMEQAYMLDESGNQIHPNHYEIVDPVLWHADRAWQAFQEGEASNVYLLQYDNRLMEIGCTSELTSQQMSLIGEKISE